ncbi:non-ribosomal peptide synthetase [Kitasatospora sp. NBC_01266]|uniref:non-ribosomal peptide synthetase n=1 Tax=Kitasatospora sp. NBC_01266 TaxID=2903572 RepID=UPI002E2FA0D3|nr:amino acid adenylation domain-containing protein [Kitasatospora sp. NBC_01266]
MTEDGHRTERAPAELAELAELAGTVLGVPPHALAGSSFAALGGTSLRAVDLAARAQAAGFGLDLPRLLGREPLAEVLATAVRVRPVTDPEAGCVAATRTGSRPASALELHMLLGEETGTSRAWNLQFSADIRGELDQGRLERAIQDVVDRHDALRTVFESGDDGLRARVIRRMRARILSGNLPPLEPAAVIDTVHAMTSRDANARLAPFVAPPVVFSVYRAAAARHILTIRIHHVITDGWSIGLLWREVFAAYVDPGAVHPHPRIPRFGEPQEAVVRARVAELAGTPTVLEPVCDTPRPAEFDHVGVRIPFALDSSARAACELLARSCGVTRNTVLFAAWNLVLARRTGSTRFLVGLSWMGRDTPRSREAVGLATALLPVVHDTQGVRTVRELLESTAGRVQDALRSAEVPFARLVSGLVVDRDPRRPTLVQSAFAAHDEMIPHALSVPGLEVRLHEGHCGGSVFDALLYVQRWERTARLCLEYSSSVYSAREAAELVADFSRVLTAMTRDPEGGVELAPLPTDSGPEVGPVPSWTSPPGLWHLFERSARRHLDAEAVDEAGVGTLTYRELLEAAEEQAARLHAAGVRTGDRVLVAVPRSARETVAILAILRCGAAYVGLEPGLPASVVERMLRIAEPVLIVADPDRAAELAGLADAPRVVGPVDPLDPRSDTRSRASGSGVLPPPAEPDPERIAYIAFTSGTSGTPKAVRIAQRGVLRLVDGSGIVAADAARRFLRFAPLSFDASTLEIFAPLAQGGAIVVLPDQHPTAAALAAFLERYSVTGLWLTAGLFRLVADHLPGAFRPVRQLLTGGDTVPPAQVRAVLERCPGIRVTNGYGPTENTTFTTVHHIDDATEVGTVLPIGRPIAGTGVLVADDDGRPVVRGAVGELLTSGLGLAVDYAGDPQDTARRFVLAPDGVRYYRTGDLARWDGNGELRILGRRDHQVKIRGFRIELDAVGRALRTLPGITDAVAVAVGDDAADRRIVAGLVAGRGVTAASVRAAAAELLPEHAIPALWALVGELPLTRQGKVDGAALVAAALSTADASSSTAAASSVTADASGSANQVAAEPATESRLEELEDRIAQIWEEVLDTDDFGYDDRFFEVGGTSLLVPVVRERLRTAYPGCEIKLVDLFAHTTVAELAAFLNTRSAVGA